MARRTAALTLAIVLPLAAQQFDVATVKINNSGSGSSGDETHRGRLVGTNLPLKSYIRTAYNVNDFQISSPLWITEDRYDINAKGSDQGGEDAFRPMLQALLAERFKLRLHRETKTFSVYALTVAKGGPKLLTTAGGDSSTAREHGHLVARASSMAHFAEVLSRTTDRPVVDRTGLPGAFDFTLNWTPDGDDAQKSNAPSLFTALQEQLGLKLEPAKAGLEVLVVDSADRVPTEN